MQNRIEIPHGIPNLHTAAELYEVLGDGIGLPFVIEKYDSEEAWKEGRRGRIGASEAASVLGIGFKTRQELFDIKTGKREDSFKGNEQTRHGQSAEPLIRALWALEHPQYEVYDPTHLIFVNKQRPWQSCSLDMVIYNPNTQDWFIGEIKTGIYNSKWSGEYCPDAYFAQICHELEVTEDFEGVFLIGRVRGNVMQIADHAWDKFYYFTSTNPAVMDERKRITKCEQKFADDMKRGVLSPVLNLI